MSEEYLDIVDEKGNLTGERELRSFCHEKGLRHRTTSIICYRKNGNNIEILPHLRSKFKSANPNSWDTRFGGHVEAGQTIHEATQRELQEETGLNIEMKNLISGPVEFYDGGKNKEVVSVFYYNFTGSLDELSFKDGEVQEVRWMSFEEIESEMIRKIVPWTGSLDGLKLIKNDLLNKI
ncbi:MAG: NUDIX domain-containing protein [bacterium]